MHTTLPRAWILITGLALAAPAHSQDAAAHVQTILASPGSPQAIDATIALTTHPDPAAAQAAIQEAWTKSPPSGVAAARLAGAAVALGAKHLDEALSQLLIQSPDEEKLAALAPLARARAVTPKVAAAVASLQEAPTPEVAQAARLAHGHLQSLGGSSGLLLFLGLLVLGAAAAFWHFSADIDDSQITTDGLVALVDEWANKPREREATMAKIRKDVEGPEARFLGLFGAEVRLTSNQVITLLDLLSHFDVDPVHEKLYEFATHRDDEIRKAAILSMHRLGDDAWTGVLAEFVRSEDEVARYAGATALARRGAVDQLPLLREELEKTRLGSVRDGMLEAIEKLEAMG
jgi:hypothetical protein